MKCKKFAIYSLIVHNCKHPEIGVLGGLVTPWSLFWSLYINRSEHTCSDLVFCGGRCKI